MLKGIGERLKKVREAQGLSQRELSKMTGIAQEAICRCETETVLPSSKTITKLARALSIDLNYLLDGEENGTIEFYGDYFDKGSKSRILPLDIPDNSNFFSLRAKKGYPCGIEENDILVLRPVNAPTSDETVLVESYLPNCLSACYARKMGISYCFRACPHRRSTFRTIKSIKSWLN